MKVDFFRSEIFGKIFGYNKCGRGIICVPIDKFSFCGDTFERHPSTPMRPIFQYKKSKIIKLYFI